ncbi:hypothetical protein SDC9_173159 [bioreactor metagenome]|uniref:Uncharacterized protein n=1 Tax=bioreactor metagenome TaxID=1076179 RepID=A0A645GP68_9ZZZZ
MAGLGGIGADECAFVIALDHVVGDFAVEEDDGDPGSFCSVYCVLRGIGRRGLNDVDDQQVGAVGDGGVDLVGLLGLVASAVVVVKGDAQCVQLLVHLVAHAGNIDVRIVVIEYRDVQIARCCCSAGSGGRSSAGRGRAAGTAARKRCEHQNGCHDDSKFFLHLFSFLLI